MNHWYPERAAEFVRVESVILQEKNLMLQFRGSANQRILDMPSTLERGEAVLAEGYR